MAAVAVLAILVGFAFAPYTHAHRPAISADDHEHSPGLVHTHAAPHQSTQSAASAAAHVESASSGDAWSVDLFVFEQQGTAQGDGPGLLIDAEVHVARQTVRVRWARVRPAAHDPPSLDASGPRAPPVSHL